MSKLETWFILFAQLSYDNNGGCGVVINKYHIKHEEHEFISSTLASLPLY